MAIAERTPVSTQELNDDHEALKKQFGVGFLVQGSEGEIRVMWPTRRVSEDYKTFSMVDNKPLDHDFEVELLGGELEDVIDEEGTVRRTLAQKVVPVEMLEMSTQKMLAERKGLTDIGQLADITPADPEVLQYYLDRIRRLGHTRRIGDLTLRAALSVDKSK